MKSATETMAFWNTLHTDNSVICGLWKSRLPKKLYCELYCTVYCTVCVYLLKSSKKHRLRSTVITWTQVFQNRIESWPTRLTIWQPFHPIRRLSFLYQPIRALLTCPHPLPPLLLAAPPAAAPMDGPPCNNLPYFPPGRHFPLLAATPPTPLYWQRFCRPPALWTSPLAAAK